MRLISIAVPLLLCAHALAEDRTWTITVKAEFARVCGGIVVLRNADGEEIPVPFSRLNIGDQRYVRNLHPVEVGAAAALNQVPNADRELIRRTVARQIPGDLALRRYVIELEAKAYLDLRKYQNPAVPPDTLRVLVQRAINEASGQFGLQLFTLENSVARHLASQNQVPAPKAAVDGIPGEIVTEITAAAAKEWPDDFAMQKNTVDAQRKAYLDLKNYRNPAVPDDVLTGIMDKAEIEWPGDYRMQVHDVERQVKAYLELRK